MSIVSDNQAAWWQSASDKSFKVGPGPDQTKPADDEVVIKVAYAALNPSEWKLVDYAYLPVNYPHVPGSDVAGEVASVGSKVTRVKPGDRVTGYCLGLVHGGAKHGGFQLFTTVRENVVAKLPDSIHLSQGAVIPLGLCTAIVGLFELMKLRQPMMDSKPSGETILIWGGSSSVGSMAIQLARAAGYDVLTTASQRNHGYARELGASDVFDHTDPDVVKKIKERLQGSKFAGAYDCIGIENSTRACAEILSGFGGGILPTVLMPPENLPENVKAEIVIASNPGTMREDNAAAIFGKQGESPLGHDYLAASIWTKFLPEALASGLLLPKPDPKILAGGLGSIQGGLDTLRKGVSAQKLVVEIDGSIK